MPILQQKRIDQEKKERVLENHIKRKEQLRDVDLASFGLELRSNKNMLCSDVSSFESTSVVQLEHQGSASPREAPAMLHEQNVTLLRPLKHTNWNGSGVTEKRNPFDSSMVSKNSSTKQMSPVM